MLFGRGITIWSACDGQEMFQQPQRRWGVFTQHGQTASSNIEQPSFFFLFLLLSFFFVSFKSKKEMRGNTRNGRCTLHTHTCVCVCVRPLAHSYASLRSLDYSSCSSTLFLHALLRLLCWISAPTSWTSNRKARTIPTLFSIKRNWFAIKHNDNSIFSMNRLNVLPVHFSHSMGTSNLSLPRVARDKLKTWRASQNTIH